MIHSMLQCIFYIIMKSILLMSKFTISWCKYFFINQFNSDSVVYVPCKTEMLSQSFFIIMSTDNFVFTTKQNEIKIYSKPRH